MLPKPLIVFVCLGLSACVSQQSHKATNKAQVALEFNREQAAKARLDLALSYLEHSNFQQAKVNFDKALMFAPRLAQVHYSRAYYFQKVGDEQQAQQSYTKAYQLAPNDPEVLHNYGSFLCTKGEFEQAKSLLLAAITSPNYAKASKTYLNLAYCSIELGYFKEAEGYLELAYNRAPENSEISLMLAGLNLGFEQYGKAMVWYQKNQHSSARGLLLGWFIYQALGFEELAKQTHQALIKRYPDSNETEQLISNHAVETEFWQLKRRILKTVKTLK